MRAGTVFAGVVVCVWVWLDSWEATAAQDLLSRGALAAVALCEMQFVSRGMPSNDVMDMTQLLPESQREVV
jgi:hypothetical protein